MISNSFLFLNTILIFRERLLNSELLLYILGSNSWLVASSSKLCPLIETKLEKVAFIVHWMTKMSSIKRERERGNANTKRKSKICEQ